MKKLHAEKDFLHGRLDGALLKISIVFLQIRQRDRDYAGPWQAAQSRGVGM